MPYSSRLPVKEAKPLCVYIIDESEWNWKPSMWYSSTHLLKDNVLRNAMNYVLEKYMMQYVSRIISQQEIL